MKTLRSNLILLVLTLVLGLPFAASARHKIYLMNPTVWNLENTLWLMQKKVIDIPDADLIGVCYSGVAYNYMLTEKFIKDKSLINCSLVWMKEDIQSGEVYGENRWTPFFKQIVADADAILFFGGPDIQPSLYGQKQHLLTVVTDPNRHLFEVSFFFQMMGGSRNESFKPLLAEHPDLIVRAFCLGMQTMNVAAGGTLMQDIPQQAYQKVFTEDVLAIDPKNQHRNYNTLLFQDEGLMGGFFHPVNVLDFGLLSELSKKTGQREPYVYSSHHQAVGEKGANLDVIAVSEDGRIVEALQHQRFKNVVGVQFHPEPPMLYNPETQSRLKPSESFAPNAYLQSVNSFSFHQAFWSDFSERINALK